MNPPHYRRLALEQGRRLSGTFFGRMLNYRSSLVGHRS
jgi:hypothetical protein